MREILFKAKRIDNGEWVIGDLSQLQSKNVIHCWNNWCREANEVFENTICQYTGLTDKNGKKIWENDIVLIIGTGYYPITEKGIVKYHAPKYLVEIHGEFPYKHDLIKIKEVKDMNATIKVEYKYEVIGNIFDNPELLESKVKV